MGIPDRSAVYKIRRGSHVMGDFDIDRIVQQLDWGELFETDFYLPPGSKRWLPLERLKAEIDSARATGVVSPKSGPGGAQSRRSSASKSHKSTSSAGVSAPAHAVKPSSGKSVLGPLFAGLIIGVTASFILMPVKVIERPVEKIVERPVDRVVERVVVRDVEVPAAPAGEHAAAIQYYQKMEDALKRRVGIGSSVLLPVVGGRIAIRISMDAVLEASAGPVAVELHKRVEDVFRAEGFEVIPADDRGPAPLTVVNVGVYRANPNSTSALTGYLQVEIDQFCIISGGDVHKKAWINAHAYRQPVSMRVGEFPSLVENVAALCSRAAEDLANAGPLPYAK